jgi:hypothetical protein
VELSHSIDSLKALLSIVPPCRSQSLLEQRFHGGEEFLDRARQPVGKVVAGRLQAHATDDFSHGASMMALGSGGDDFEGRSASPQAAGIAHRQVPAPHGHMGADEEIGQGQGLAAAA